MEHAAAFIETRLAPAEPANDGRQTPMRNHPVFIAQHATATCCRGCLEKWHRIPLGRALDEAERRHVLGVLARWLTRAEAEQGRAAGRRSFPPPPIGLGWRTSYPGRPHPRGCPPA